MTVTLAAMICYMIFAHTVADFVFQTDAMAINKSKSHSWLLRHTGMYALILGAILGMGGLLGLFATPLFPNGAVFILVNFVAHTITDYITSRITSHYWKLEKRHQFFVTIGFDQFAHIAVLLLTWTWLL